MGSHRRCTFGYEEYAISWWAKNESLDGVNSNFRGSIGGILKQIPIK